MTKMKARPLDDFELGCILDYFASDVVSLYIDTDEDAKRGARLRSRVRRFVLTHPAVTPELARRFCALQRKARND